MVENGALYTQTLCLLCGVFILDIDPEDILKSPLYSLYIVFRYVDGKHRGVLGKHRGFRKPRHGKHRGFQGTVEVAIEVDTPFNPNGTECWMVASTQTF